MPRFRATARPPKIEEKLRALANSALHKPRRLADSWFPKLLRIAKVSPSKTLIPAASK
jgi:hypothetical protein